MSRRASNAYDNVTRSPARLPRGHAGPVGRLTYNPVAALNISCDGRPGYTCDGLRRYTIDGDGHVTQQRGGNRLAHIVQDSAATTYEWDCRCGESVVLSVEVVRRVLVDLVARGKPQLRLSATRLASLHFER